MYGFQESQNFQNTLSNGGKFGLNTGVNITVFEYESNEKGESLNIHYKVGERVYKTKIFPITKVWKEGVELTDTNSEDYKEEFKIQTKLLSAMVTDIALCFVNEEVLKQVLDQPINSFKQYVETLERLIKANPSWDKTPLDLFLQYQWQPSKGQTRTFLEVPKNIKQGSFICKSMGEGFVEDKTETHLKYYKEDVEHPFKRSSWFINSAYANMLEVSDNGEDINIYNTSSTTTDLADW